MMMMMSALPVAESTTLEAQMAKQQNK